MSIGRWHWNGRELVDVLGASFGGGAIENPFYEAIKTSEEREADKRVAFAKFESQIFGPKARQAHAEAERASYGSGG